VNRAPLRFNAIAPLALLFDSPIVFAESNVRIAAKPTHRIIRDLAGDEPAIVAGAFALRAKHAPVTLTRRRKFLEESAWIPDRWCRPTTPSFTNCSR
jgi:hypothetical protein